MKAQRNPNTAGMCIGARLAGTWNWQYAILAEVHPTQIFEETHDYLQAK